MQKNYSGFTFIELVIVLSIVSILAVASFSGLSIFQHQHEQILKNQFKSLLETAQQESSNGKDVGLCRSLNGESCQDKGNHWLLFFDAYGDGSIQQKNQVIGSRYINMKHGSLVLRSYPKYRQYLRFSSDSILEGDNAAISFYRLNISRPIWQLMINRAGRVREVE